MAHAFTARPLLATLIAASLALPFAAQAQDKPPCRHSQPRELALQLDGVRTVRFEIGNSRLRVDGAERPDANLRGRACASSEAMLASLVLEQQRSGETLTVTLRRTSNPTGWLGNQYAYMDLAGQVPANVLVLAVVGSGDAWVNGVAAASADVGSGDAQLRRIGGRATAKVGSGDVTVEEAGELKVLSIGSGDVEARNIRSAVEVGSVGSGDFRLEGAGGDVRIGSLGSGDIDLRDVQGNVHVGSIGSGDVDARGIGGNLEVASQGSGDVSHRDVRGTVSVPRRR
ncbi:hypothetical protein CNR27_10190 [Luteimonas chenhongjianii]|uniref:Putative auto-transporter adhesin head GIN domain-containing protein n=1 Tax=Luteimonas chenhongjianii TaxID=2006110 RepID=A0A290XF43_9GAMM|nr:DUF2807 domain-containing protein [Luteimonas chenhongjianii]ATD67755.1 hypothetical protein CNR27_10190 [Luteimonas chenhongjianii]